MAGSEEVARLLDEVAAADTFDAVQDVVARWRWKLAVEADPALGDRVEGPLREDGTPISIDQLRPWLGED